eukprot:TRINITY_DN6624_c0_g1_i1.p1 TRINITY_DN6624_c0_g1~~TRINITY_DN6624_c0_g1_i1.p1  ORF type:complete len:158 (+),score=30.19 TRINITY_DN6624_c0_g1_i1:57-530(+)
MTEETVQENKVLPYTWTQTRKDVTLIVKIPKPVRSRDLEVIVTKTNFSVRLKGEKGYIAKGEFYKTVKEDHVWHLDDGTDLYIELVKVDTTDMGYRWKCACKGDPEVDTWKLHPDDGAFEDYDYETRMGVLKMMQDDEKKGLLPGGVSKESLLKQSK